MKIYIDCCQLARPHLEVGIKGTVSELLALKSRWNASRRLSMNFRDRFSRGGIEVLDFGTEGFNPNHSSITDFVCSADAVVALLGYPFLGFSMEGRIAALKFSKPLFLFVPHLADFSVIRSETPLFVRSLFCTPNFPTRVLYRFLLQEIKAAA